MKKEEGGKQRRERERKRHERGRVRGHRRKSEKGRAGKGKRRIEDEAKIEVTVRGREMRRGEMAERRIGRGEEERERKEKKKIKNAIQKKKEIRLASLPHFFILYFVFFMIY